MDSSASKRFDRVAAATCALLLQIGFVALLIQSMRPAATGEKLAQELLFILPRLASPAVPTAPTTIDARGRPPRLTAPAPIVPAPAPPTALRAIAPSPDISSLGQDIFGCALENYSSLTPERRAHCTRPGEGFAIQDAPDPLHPPPSQAKDEALWQEQWTEDHFTLEPCTGNGVVDCLLAQWRGERKRAAEVNSELAEKKAAALQEPKRPLPQNIGVYPH